MAPWPGEDDRMRAAYTLLGERRRRYLLYVLAEVEVAAVTGLATQIAAWEDEVPVAAVAEPARRSVQISLVHTHLPMLADHSVVDYDLRTGDVVRADGFEAVEALLERFRETEAVPECRLSSPSVERP